MCYPKILSNLLSCRFDQAAALTAMDRPGDQRHDQRAADHSQYPDVPGEPRMMRQPGIFVQRGHRQHARQHMRRRP